MRRRQGSKPAWARGESLRRAGKRIWHYAPQGDHPRTPWGHVLTWQESGEEPERRRQRKQSVNNSRSMKQRRTKQNRCFEPLEGGKGASGATRPGEMASGVLPYLSREAPSAMGLLHAMPLLGTLHQMQELVQSSIFGQGLERKHLHVKRCMCSAANSLTLSSHATERQKGEKEEGKEEERNSGMAKTGYS